MAEEEWVYVLSGRTWCRRRRCAGSA